MTVALSDPLFGRPRISPEHCRCGAPIRPREYVCAPCDRRNVLTVLALACFLRREEPGLADTLVRLVDGNAVLGAYVSGGQEVA